MTVLAPAKINIGLKVLPRREDGYHNIESIFSTVNLYDTLFVEKTGKQNECIVTCSEMELPVENTFTLTYKAFCVLTGVSEGVRVCVSKRIPTGGGLGGGSSDSASFLYSLNIMFGTHLEKSALAHLSGQVGSDVFFFTEALIAKGEGKIYTGSPFVALVTGRGERVTQIDGRNDYSVLLVFPRVFVSTKQAYSLVDEAMALNANVSTTKMGILMEEMYKKPVREWFFKNDFTAPVSECNPLIGQALASLKNAGADFVDMSGSGSTVFGIFENNLSAQKAAKMLAGKWRTVLL